MPFFDKNTIPTEKNRDTGLAFVLILLLASWFWQQYNLLLPAIFLLLATMIWPPVFKLPARLWFGLSHLIGGVVSKVLLTVVFFVIVLPVGLLRRLFGADPLRLTAWKNGRQSVFTERNHLFEDNDLHKPF